MDILPACMCVHQVCTWCLWRSDKRLTPPGTGDIDGSVVMEIKLVLCESS